MPRIRKYPRTHHLEGSRLQPGDGDLDSVALADLAGQHLVIEEKIDGANAAISFDATGELYLQSRGHFLTGGGRERHFALFKTWAQAHRPALWSCFGDRYVVYGEWLYAKHTIYYDELPHYFLEFDVLDLASDAFLSTERRRELLAGTPLVSVPVLWRGESPAHGPLAAMVTGSRYKSPRWRDRLSETAAARGLEVERVRDQTDRSDEMEGLYVKVERDGRVEARLKFIRPSFLTSVLDADSHWQNRPILPNRLASGVDLFAAGTERV